MSEEEREADRFESRHGAERWLLPYFEDSALWPVLIVVLAHVAAFEAAALLFAIRDHLPVAVLGNIFLVIGSVIAIRWEWRTRGGLGVFTASIGLTWLASGGIAWLGWRYAFL